MTIELLCGDARRRKSFRALLSGKTAQLVFVDPPYNVKIRGHVSGKGRVKHREFAQASGEKTSAQFTKFLEESLGLLAEYSADGAIHFVCSDWRHLDEMLTAGRRIYRDLKNLVIWNKTNAGMGSFYRSQHELIFVWNGFLITMRIISSASPSRSCSICGLLKRTRSHSKR